MRTSGVQTVTCKIVVTYHVGMSESTGSPTWTLIFALPAAVAAVVAAMNGASQLSRSARARRTIEWIDSTIDKCVEDDLRRHRLAELRTEQEASLVATYYVPWWRLVLFPVWVIAVGALLIFTSKKGISGTVVVRGVAYHFLFTAYFAWLFIGSYREKLRIIDHYRAGILSEPRIPLWRMGNKLVGVALWCTAGIYLLGGGLVFFSTAKYAQLATVSLVVGYTMLFTTLPYVKRYIQSWTVVTKTGSERLGNETSNFPRSFAIIFGYLEPQKVDGKLIKLFNSSQCCT